LQAAVGARRIRSPDSHLLILDGMLDHAALRRIFPPSGIAQSAHDWDPHAASPGRSLPVGSVISARPRNPRHATPHLQQGTWLRSGVWVERTAAGMPGLSELARSARQPDLQRQEAAG
jgi:hypothetical protein